MFDVIHIKKCCNYFWFLPAEGICIFFALGLEGSRLRKCRSFFESNGKFQKTGYSFWQWKVV